MVNLSDYEDLQYICVWGLYTFDSDYNAIDAHADDGKLVLNDVMSLNLRAICSGQDGNRFSLGLYFNPMLIEDNYALHRFLISEANAFLEEEHEKATIS